MPSDFNVVAACLHAVTERWEFRYVLPTQLPDHRKCVGRISNLITVSDPWVSDPTRVFEAAYAVVGSAR
jgi:hypothetical protein